MNADVIPARATLHFTIFIYAVLLPPAAFILAKVTFILAKVIWERLG